MSVNVVENDIKAVMRAPPPVPVRSSSAPTVLNASEFPNMAAYFETLPPPNDAISHREPDVENNIDLDTLPLHTSSAGKQAAKWVAAGLLSVSLVGIPYVVRSYVLVEPGQLGVCTDMHGTLELYKPGRHLVMSPYSQFDVIDMDTPHTVYRKDKSGGGLFQIVNVPAGSIGVALDNNKAVILNTGKHVIRSTGFIFKGVHATSAPHVLIGDVNIINVAPDKVGWGEDRGQVVVLRPGRHVIQSSTFVFKGAVEQSRNYIDMSSIALMTVPQNTAYVLQMADGARAIATQGFYVLRNAAQITVTKTPIALNWQEVTFKSQVRTQDSVALNIEAALFLRIADAQTALSSISQPIEYVLTRAQGVLTNIISESPLTRASVSVRDLPAGGTQPPTYAFDGGSVHTRFEDALRTEFLEHGIDLKSMRVINWQFQDHNFAMRMAEAASASANIKVASDNAEREKQILLVKTEAQAQALLRTAQAEAEALTLRRKAERSTFTELYTTIVDATGDKVLAAQAVRSKLIETTISGSKLIISSGQEGVRDALACQLLV